MPWRGFNPIPDKFQKGSKMSVNVKIKQAFPLNHEECKRETCMLRMAGPTGEKECLMDSVRPKWNNPSATNYCEDPACSRFVQAFHQRQAEKMAAANVEETGAASETEGSASQA
jgi:hypothetical protein